MVPLEDRLRELRRRRRPMAHRVVTGALWTAGILVAGWLLISGLFGYSSS